MIFDFNHLEASQRSPCTALQGIWKVSTATWTYVRDAQAGALLLLHSSTSAAQWEMKSSYGQAMKLIEPLLLYYNLRRDIYLATTACSGSNAQCI